MSQIIVIESSDEEAKSRPFASFDQPESGAICSTDERIERNDSETEILSMDKQDLFLEFTECCSRLVKDNLNGQKIVKFVQKKYDESSEEYKSSRPFRKLLQSCISKFKEGSQDVYVHVHDVVSMLDKNKCLTGRKRMCKLETAEESSTSIAYKTKRISTVVESKIVSNADLKMQIGECAMKVSDEISDQDKDIAGTSVNTDKTIKRKHSRSIKRLEVLLKKISNEIVRLQSTELSLEDLDKDDTSYIQESNLKKRFMQIYQQLCKMNQSPLLTGRVKERKIKVTASRFTEINTKIELFINNPKRGDNFPDFADIFHLVKQANEKNKLDLGQAQMQSIAECVFTEVGESMQRRRHQDFIYEFGCAITDKENPVSDPASLDPNLITKLTENRTLAKLNLDTVIEKYTKIQNEMGEAKLESITDASATEEKEEIPSDDNLLNDISGEEIFNAKDS